MDAACDDTVALTAAWAGANRLRWFRGGKTTKRTRLTPEDPVQITFSCHGDLSSTEWVLNLSTFEKV
jgi:hypothetical protein